MDQGSAKYSNVPKPKNQGTHGSLEATCQPKRCMDTAPRDTKNTQGKQISKTTSIVLPGDGTHGSGTTVNSPGFGGKSTKP